MTNYEIIEKFESDKVKSSLDIAGGVFVETDLVHEIVKALRSQPCEDTISRQAAIEALENTKEVARYIESGYCDGYEDAKRKYEPRWRNIEEELPQEAGDVIIYTDHVMAGYYAWGKWFDDKNELVTPTHWMPWPSAPERRQDK